METVTAKPPQSPASPATTTIAPAAPVSTAAVVATMVRVSKQVSDLIFSRAVCRKWN